MMWPAFPFPVQMIVLAVVGAFLGSLATWAADRLAWQSRAVSLWSRVGRLGPRHLAAYVPILGWFFQKSPSEGQGRWSWLPPFCVECLSAAGLPWLYWWEVCEAAIVPAGVLPPPFPVLLVVFIKHTILLLFMLVASLIDWDEKVIPDAVTIPGTLLGLILAAVVPASHLPVPQERARPPLISASRAVPGAVPATYLKLTSPSPWPESLNGQPHGHALSLGLFCWWLWCFALMPRRWYRHRRFWKAVQLMCARLYRSQVTGGLLVMGFIGTAVILFVWILGGDPWRSLLSALVGMAATAGLTWIVRIVGTLVLDREALGFGDVTLMAMIGSYLGWQPGLILFFLAPFAGLVVAIYIIVRHQEVEIPYGPFLCLGALATIVFWRDVWGFASLIFELGGILPLLLVALIVLLAFLLLVIRLIREGLRI